MIKKVLLGISGFCFLLVMTSSIPAVDFRTEKFALLGTGSLMDSPPIFSGDIYNGTLSPGSFYFELDDTGWPADDPGTPENERWDYIFSNYFEYDNTPDNEGWDGYFPSSSLGDMAPAWRFYTDAGDTLGGLCSSFTITIRDFNGNAVIDGTEYETKVFSAGLVCYINFNKGCFTSYCGQGNCSGTINLLNEVTWEEEMYVPSATSASGRLDLRDINCHTDTDPSSWGAIKAIHSE
ncbi:MAG: hypothetical protein JXB45_00770 [Candidatus Krumholzibacteriota bacterium]|nr:hypothetical protein [Candidatus Krumholzibacteriota bacterium]